MKPDIIVIGGGIAGLASAWALSQRGARVEIIERGPLGRESSWAGAGILSLLMPWSYSPALVQLAEQSIDRYPDWIATLGQTTPIDPEYRRSGMLVKGGIDAGAATDWLKRHPTHEAPARVAAFGPGLWLPGIAQVRNPRLIQALADAVRQDGVTITEQAGEVHLERQGGRVAAAISVNRRWIAERYVVATGAWSTVMLGPLAGGLNVRPIRGQILLYKTDPERLPCLIYEDGHYLVPRADGHILAGATLEDVGFDKSTTDEAFTSLRDMVHRTLPDLADSPPVMHWAGLRPGSPDNVPTVDRHPELANLYVNTGHFRYGVTLAPICAELLVDRMENKSQGEMHRLCAWPAILRAAPV